MKNFKFIFLLAVALAGCVSYEDLSGVVGLWTREKGGNDFEYMNVRQDGRFTWHHVDVARRATEDLAGTWTREGDKLIVREQSRDGQPIPTLAVEFTMDSPANPAKLTTATGYQLDKYSPAKK